MKRRIRIIVPLLIFGSFVTAFLYRSLAPRAILADLFSQRSALVEAAFRLEQKGNFIAALRMAQVAILVSPETKDQRLETLVARLEPIERDMKGSIGNQSAEALVASEVQALGDPLVTQLVVVLSEAPRQQGPSCVGLRVLAMVSRDGAERVVRSTIVRGQNDIFTREAVVEALRLRISGLEGELVRLVENWRQWGRQYPIYVLRRFGARQAVDAIITALDDTSPAVQRHSAMALADLAGGEALEPLSRLAARSKDEVTISIVEAAQATIRRRLPHLEKNSGLGSQ